MFAQIVHYQKALRKYYDMISISKIYFGNQNFRPSKFRSIFCLYMKIKMPVNQQIPNGISCSVPCWKAIDLWIKIVIKATQISLKKFRVELEFKIAFWN